MVVFVNLTFRFLLNGQCLDSDISLVASLLVKIDAATLGVNYSQNITQKKMFQRQLWVPPHKETLLYNTYMKKKYFTFI